MLCLCEWCSHRCVCIVQQVFASLNLVCVILGLSFTASGLGKEKKRQKRFRESMDTISQGKWPVDPVANPAAASAVAAKPQAAKSVAPKKEKAAGMFFFF